MNDLSEPPPNVQSLRNIDPHNTLAADSLDVSPMNLEVTDDPFDRLDSLSPAVICDHPTLGFDIAECHIRRRGYVSSIVPRTSAARIRNVRRKYIGAYVVSINGSAVFTAAEIIAALQAIATSDARDF